MNYWKICENSISVRHLVRGFELWSKMYKQTKVGWLTQLVLEFLSNSLKIAARTTVEIANTYSSKQIL